MSAEIANQHNVTRNGPARDGQLFPITGPVEPEHVIRFEIRQLLRSATIYRLTPNIGYSRAGQNISHCPPTRGPTNRALDWSPSVKNLDRLTAFEGYERYFVA